MCVCGRIAAGPSLFSLWVSEYIFSPSGTTNKRSMKFIDELDVGVVKTMVGFLFSVGVFSHSQRLRARE